MVPKGWSIQTVSSVLDKVVKPVGVVPTETYYEIGIRSHGKGIFYKDPIKGKDLGNKRVFHIEPNCLVVNIVFAWEQAIAKTTNVDGGKIASHRFPMYKPKSNRCDIDYVLYLLKTKKGKYLLELASPGGAGRNKTLGQAEFSKLELLLPPIEEQKKISKILSTWDQAISTTEQLLANSQQQKKALMQQLLTGKKRLLDKNGVRFSGEWKPNTLGKIAQVYQPKTISQSDLTTAGYPVYGANGIIGFFSDFNHENEQVAVTCRGSTCGVVNWTKPKSWITGNAMVVNVDNNSEVDKKFIYYVLCGCNLTYLISGSGQPQITGNIKNHLINIPTLDEQQKIASVLTAADQEIATLRRKLDCLKQEKKALMQQLLTGKRRVKVGADEGMTQ